MRSVESLAIVCGADPNNSHTKTIAASITTRGKSPPDSLIHFLHAPYSHQLVRSSRFGPLAQRRHPAREAPRLLMQNGNSWQGTRMKSQLKLEPKWRCKTRS
jgi:hypothetical protein